MSFNAVVQLVLHLENYYILEYPHQGLFSFHCSIFQLKEGQPLYAIPYQILPNLQQKIQELPTRIIVEPNINDFKAFSSVGLAKYSDELIDLNNWFRFRLELQAYPQLQTDNIFLSVEFRFNNKDLSQPQQPGELIQTVTFRLNDLQNGIFNYVEAHFSAPYLSKVNMTLMGFISSFKFGKYQPFVQQLSKQQKRRKKIATLPQLVDFARSQLPKQKIESVFYNSYIKKLRISQYLIEQRMNNISKQPQTLDIKLCKQFKVQHNYPNITSKQFKLYLDSYTPDPLTIQQIMHEINQIKEQNFNFLQNAIMKWMQQAFDQDRLILEFQNFGKQKYGEMVFKSTVVATDPQTQENTYQENKKIAHKMRNHRVVLNNYPIEDLRFEENKEEQELVFYQITLPFKNKTEMQQLLAITPEEQLLHQEACKLQYSEKHMLVVLCHGYQGTPYDMVLIKRWIQLQLPDAHFLLSRSNEGDTDNDIKSMGKKLAEEIEKYISNYLEEYEQENVIINLVGHSMGGVIARAALPHLEKYNKQMGFFCSLSSPHLGYLNGVSGLIKVGLWAIRKFKNIQSLSQLSMEERGDPRKTFLYDLSHTGHLRYFRKIILLSSYEDSYVSWHSARISTHRSTNSLSKLENQMVNNIIGNNIYGATVHRLDINFNVRQKNLDSFIGRTAHINLIIRQNLFKTLSITLPNLFELTEFGREGLFL